MWKNFFYFPKSQRIGIIVLIALIILTFLANNLLPLFFKNKESDVSEDFLNELKEFRANLQSKDSIRQAQWQQEYQNRYQNSYANANRYSSNPSYELFAFDPNSADSITFSRLGLRPYLISNILRYRAQGGSFKTPDDLSKIYGLNDEKFKELKPHIQIENRDEKIHEIAEKNKPTETQEAIPNTEKFIVELNSADTTELKMVKGIGSYLANKIVQFRRNSGGFVSVEQLKEIQGMRPENYERVKDFCVADTRLVEKISVNTASAEKLNRHPYLNFYQSKALYEYRRKKGKIHSIKELYDINEFSEEDILKIEAYLNFD